MSSIRQILKDNHCWVTDKLGEKCAEAINQYIEQEIIGADEEVKMEYIRTHTGEVLGPMTDDIVTPQLNRFRAEQRKSLTKAREKK